MAHHAFSDLNAVRLPEIDLLDTNTSSVKGIAVRKPARDEWIRTSRQDNHQPLRCLIYDNRAERKLYYIMPRPELQQLFLTVAKPSYLYVAISRDEEVFLSLVGGTDHPTPQGCRKLHLRARDEWLRIFWGGDKKPEWLCQSSPDYTEDPTFPAADLGDLLAMAFPPEQIIDGLEHKEAKKMRGVL